MYGNKLTIRPREDGRDTKRNISSDYDILINDINLNDIVAKVTNIELKMDAGSTPIMIIESKVDHLDLNGIKADIICAQEGDIIETKTKDGP